MHLYSTGHPLLLASINAMGWEALVQHWSDLLAYEREQSEWLVQLTERRRETAAVPAPFFHCFGIEPQDRSWTEVFHDHLSVAIEQVFLCEQRREATANAAALLRHGLRPGDVFDADGELVEAKSFAPPMPGRRLETMAMINPVVAHHGGWLSCAAPLSCVKIMPEEGRVPVRSDIRPLHWNDHLELMPALDPQFIKWVRQSTVRHNPDGLRHTHEAYVAIFFSQRVNHLLRGALECKSNDVYAVSAPGTPRRIVAGGLPYVNDDGSWSLAYYEPDSKRNTPPSLTLVNFREKPRIEVLARAPSEAHVPHAAIVATLIRERERQQPSRRGRRHPSA